MAGQVVQKGALNCQGLRTPQAHCRNCVPESEIADVKVGQKGPLKVRAYPNQTFMVRSFSVATSALAENSTRETGSLIPVTHAASATTAPARTILVTTEIDNDSLLLKPGMTGHAKVFLWPAPVIDIMTRRLARTVRVDSGPGSNSSYARFRNASEKSKNDYSSIHETRR